jgi:hypothetical protein
VAPLLPAALHTYWVAREVQAHREPLVAPSYPAVLALLVGLPPLMLVGGFLSYVLPRPQHAAARFALGLLVGTVLLVIAQTGAIRF